MYTLRGRAVAVVWLEENEVLEKRLTGVMKR